MALLAPSHPAFPLSRLNPPDCKSCDLCARAAGNPVNPVILSKITIRAIRSFDKAHAKARDKASNHSPLTTHYSPLTTVSLLTMHRLIINADDFGFSPHTVDWTLRCFEAGVLSSATIMAGAADFQRAAAFARANPQWSFGLHLVLSDEIPLCPPASIPSMVAPDGHLWPTRQFMLRSAVGLIRSADLEREIRAQLLRLRGAGVAVSHLDGHGHLHRMPLVLKALIRLKDELDLARLRPAQDLYYAPPRLQLGLWFNCAVNRSLRRHFAAPDHFLMTTGKVSSAQADWFREMLPRLPGGCTEIGIHPGTDEPWRQLDTDDLLRHGRDAMLQAGLRLVSYHDVKGR